MTPIRFAAYIGVLLGALHVSGAGAQTFPSRPVRYIMPLPAGGETDVFARVLARRMGEGLKQNVIVDNRPGGATMIGTAVAANAAPDGYTLLHAVTAHAINPTLQPKVPYDTLKDLACVTQIGSFSSVLVAHPSFPAKTVPELVKLVKAQPGKIVYATGPVGTTNHILGESLNSAAGIRMLHVPYKGGGLAVQDLLAGNVPLVANVVLEMLPYIRTGRVRAIAVTGPKRTPALPNVPTVSESLPAYRSGESFWALLTRTGTPAAVVKRLNAEVLKAMKATDVRERIVQMDIEPVGSTPAQCDAFLRAQIETWSSIVRASGAKTG
ncbi:MAG TPA: tripartite tricarboxylate transporter substrate binding protein [Burkholderiales bacterium]